MALRTEAIGQRTEPLEHTYRWQDVALYALAVGAGQDDLDLVYERRGPKVLPSYAVVPAFQACRRLFDAVGGDLAGVVHGSQRIQMHAPIPPSGTLRTIGEVAGVHDLKRMGQSTIRTETTDETGKLLFETEWTIIYLMDGGFGGDPPPRSPKIRPPERAPDWVTASRTHPEQALLYRLASHDYNPLHADPDAAKMAEKVTLGRPILHGLCTYGLITRAVIANECGGNPARLKTLYGRFSKPIWPGETVVTEGWRVDGRTILRAATSERPTDYIFTNAYAEITG